jgi:heme exporter protein D
MFDFQFDSLGDFLAMGGYAYVVWGSYGFFAIVMVWNLIQPRLDRRNVIRLLKARMQRESSGRFARSDKEEQA